MTRKKVVPKKKTVAKKKATTKKKIVDTGKPAKKKGPGRPEKVFKDEEKILVQMMRINGLPQQRIADIMQCSIHTLRKHCHDELEYGIDIANGHVCGALYNNAVTLNNVVAQNTWLARNAGWTKNDEQKNQSGGNLTINLFPSGGDKVVLKTSAPPAPAG